MNTDALNCIPEARCRKICRTDCFGDPIYRIGLYDGSCLTIDTRDDRVLFAFGADVIPGREIRGVDHLSDSVVLRFVDGSSTFIRASKGGWVNLAYDPPDIPADGT